MYNKHLITQLVHKLFEFKNIITIITKTRRHVGTAKIKCLYILSRSNNIKSMIDITTKAVRLEKTSRIVSKGIVQLGKLNQYNFTFTLYMLVYHVSFNKVILQIKHTCYYAIQIVIQVILHVVINPITHTYTQLHAHTHRCNNETLKCHKIVIRI